MPLDDRSQCPDIRVRGIGAHTDVRSSLRPQPTTDARRSAGERRAPLAFIIDEEGSIRQFVSLILQGSGVDTIEFADGASFRDAPIARPPDLVFLNVNLEVQDAVQSIETLGKSGFTGAVQLMSSRGSAVLETVKQAGEQHKLRMLPVLKKPFETSAIQKIMSELKLGHARRRPRSRSSLPKRSRTTGSSSGTSPRSICAESSSPAPRPSRASAIRSTASCCRAASCRAPTTPAC